MKFMSSIFLSFFLAYGNLSAQVSYTENSDAAFSAGTFDQSRVVTGAGASVLLDYYGHSSGFDAPASNSWYNGSWKYRIPALVNSSNPSALSNYTVPLYLNTQAEISAGRMKADGSDIRFTTSALTGIPVSLPYYVESGLNTSSTKIWVKILSVLNGSNTVYMYTGNDAASAESSINAAFVVGDAFTGTDGSAPSSSTWVSVESGSPLAGSSREIQSNSLRLRFGSSLGLKHYGLRSSNYYSLAAGRRYHFDVNARSSGSDAWSSFTLCPSIYSYSYDQDDWLRFSVKHSASGAVYTVEKSEFGVKSNLLSATSVSAGLHGVDIIVTSSTVRVLVDGSQVYSGANNLSFSNPYVYLEATSSYNGLEDFVFDNLMVAAYSPPEPVFSSAGAGQGRLYPSGYFLSQSKNSGANGTKIQVMDWTASLPSGSTMTVLARAHDTDLALGTFTAVSKGGSPAVYGKYLQYKLSFETDAPLSSPSLSSMTLTYVSPPSSPTSPGGEALSAASINWRWQDSSSGQYQEDGFRVSDTSGSIKGSVLAGATYFIEAGLAPNTQYTRNIYGYNAAGNGVNAVVARYTLPAVPNVSCDKSTGTWLSGNLICSNLAGFGANGVGYYRYAWTTSPTYPSWSGSETQWLSGTLSYSPGVSGEYYLHVRSYNSDGFPELQDKTYGPYWYDKVAAQITGFSPSSSAWTNTSFPVQISMTDSGGSDLNRIRYQWTTYVDKPSIWQAWDYAIYDTTSAVVSRTYGGEGVVYLHVEVEDIAGNVTYAYNQTDSYKLDKTVPTGSVSISGGAVYTPTRDVVLNLTYSDGASGVKELYYRNVPGSFSNPELPQATTSWTMLAGDGTKTVALQVKDNAGNFSLYSDTIILDSRTSLEGSNLAATASGVMGESPESFSAEASIRWTPTGALLSGKTLSFNFGASTRASPSDAFGYASSTFSVPTASGTYVYNISFSTDGVYSASSATGTLTVSQRAVSLVTEDLNTTSGGNFIAKATLKDRDTEFAVTGATVTFYFEGSTQTAFTNGVGVATVTFTAPVTVGFYDYTAVYDGNQVYGYKSGNGRIGVGLRVTTLVVPPLSSPGQASFNAQATLMDSTTPVSGATISFLFGGSTQTAVTNSSGVAVSGYTAPYSSGTYSYSASFAGDGTYAPSSGGSSLTVTPRPLSLVSDAINGYVNASFQSRAVLYDGINSDRVQGKSLAFSFETSSAAVVTDSNGVSTTNFSSGATPRVSSYYVSFAGDPGYSFADSTSTVTIARRPVTLSGFDTSSLVNSSFTAAAELKDVAFSAVPIEGKTVYFGFQGSTKTALTGSDGIASVSFDTGLSTGTYDFYCWTDQDSTYEADLDTAAVSIAKRPAVLSAYPKFVFAFDGIQLVADLKDGISGEYLGGYTVVFDYNSSQQSTTTVISTGPTLGRAYAVYSGTGVAGSYSYSVSFAGDSVYSASSSTGSISVLKRSVNISAFPVTAVWSTTFTATAEMRDGATSAFIQGKTLRMVFQSSTVYNATNSSGSVSTNFLAPASTGSYNWVADFAGDAAYAAGSSTGTVTVSKRLPTLTALPANKYVLDSVYITATLFDDVTPVGSKLLSFYFRGSTLTATTSAGGSATAGPFTAISTPGAYACQVSFAGDNAYSAQTSSTTITGIARVSRLNAGGKSTIANSTFTLTSTLLDDVWGSAIGGATLNFLFQSVSSAAVTNSTGIASVTYTAPSSTGTYPYTVSFAGNTTYSATSGGDNVTVTLRPTTMEMGDYSPPASSTFTVSVVLKDYTTGAKLSSKTVSFLFLGSTKTAVTDALGQASTTYVTLASTSSYPISASFAGDSLYAATSIQRTVFPAKRNTSVLTSDITSAVAKDTFTMTARLKDYDEGYFIAGATLTFSFTGSTYTQTAITNSTGIASVVFKAPTSTGTYSYTASFPGDALYSSSLNTSSVLVNRRNLSVEPGDFTSLPANSTFTANCYVKDGTITLSGYSVSFVFISTKTSVTNAVGYATNSFIAPASTGTYYYAAKFNGDALYNPQTAYASLSVILRPTLIELLDVNDAVVGVSFLGTAKLRDIEDGNSLVVATKTVQIVFGTSTVNSVTQVGVATAAFTAPLTTGTYSYSASFAGDGVYGASNSTATIIVNRRPVLFGMVIDPTQPYAFRPAASNSSFTVTATLCDGEVAGLCLDNKTIRFVFQGSTQTKTTNALGVTSATFSSPVSSGTYSYYAYFDGDASYNPNAPESSTKTMSVIQRPTLLLPKDGTTGSIVAGSYNYVHTIDGYNTTAILKDQMSNQGIQSMSVSFYVLGSTRTGSSDASGIATTSSAFPYVVNEGIYSATAAFAGNATYAPSDLPGSTNWSDVNTGKIRVYVRPAFFDLAQETQAYPNETKPINGTLRDWWGNATANPYLIGYPFSYRICSLACTGGSCDSTDVSACNSGGYWSSWSNGTVTAGNVATGTVVTPGVAGDYPIGYTFTGTSIFYHHDPWTSFPRYIRVGKRLTFITADAEPFTYGAQMPVSVKVTLRDLTTVGYPGINGKTLKVVLVDISTQNLTTGSGGAAGKVNASFSGLAVGTYPYVATFEDGDPTYLGFQSTGTVVIEKNTTILTADSVSNIPAGNSFTAQATLMVQQGTSTVPMAGKTIYFVFPSTGPPDISLQAVTNGLGIATVTFPSPYVPGNYNYTAELPEDDDFKYAGDLTNSVGVIKRHTVITAQNASVYILDNFLSTATLVDSDLSNAPVPGKNISFILHKGPDAPASALTNGIGVASTTYASPSSSGAYNYSATFPGDALYDVSSDTKTVNVLRRTTFMDVPTLIAPTNSTFTVYATLTDITPPAIGISTPIAGVQVKFVFNGGGPVYAATNSTGTAEYTFTAPANAGSYSVTATFEGNQTYDISNKTTPLTIRKRITVLSGNDVLVPAGTPFTAQVLLVDEFGTKLNNYNVNFVFNTTPAVNSSHLTNSNGISTVTFTSPSSTGAYNYEAYFAGDATYEMSSDLANLVDVSVASTTITVPDGSVTVNDLYYATATLTNTSSGQGVPGKMVDFTYNGVGLSPAMTVSDGKAVRSFTPTSTGTYRLDVAFAGDSAFYSSSSSSTITVNRRNSGVTLADVATKSGLVFTATATLKDLSSAPNTLVQGRTLTFEFDGGFGLEQKQAVTNALGIATVTYTAPASAGAYPITVSFAGDEIYVSTNNAATVTVSKRITILSVSTGSISALENFTATATFIDKDGGYVPVGGAQINFYYKGSTFTAWTDGEGKAYGDFYSGASSGPWRMDAVFDGTADPTYSSASSSSTITVLRRTCRAVPDNISLAVFDVFNSTVSFYDIVSSSTPAGKVVSVGLLGSTYTTTATNGSGIAYKTGLTAPSSSGTYKVEAFYLGDATYQPSLASTATITVISRPSAVSLADVNTTIGRVFTATATLRDATNSSLLGDKSVRFIFEGNTFIKKTGTGGSLGIAVATFTVTISTGANRIDAVFDGDASYFASNSASATVTAAMMPTALTPQSATVFADKVFKATATLRDIDSQLVQNKTVEFTFQGSSYTATSNSVGVATVSITANVSTGTYGLGVYFPGDYKYMASSTTLSLTVNRRPTSVVPSGVVSVKALDVFYATVTLRDMDSLTVSNKTVRFLYSGSSFYVLTDGGGVAVSTYSAGASSGTYYAGAYFDGDEKYASSTAPVTIIISQRTTGISVLPVTIRALDLFNSTATLSDVANPGLQLANKTVSFSFTSGGSTSAKTNDVGFTTAPYTAAASAGSYQLTGSFAGDATYASTSAVVALNVIKRDCYVTGVDVSTRVLDVFLASATLQDLHTDAYVASKTIKFSLLTSSMPAVTNGVGLGTAAFTAPASSGTYSLYSQFLGDSTYNASPVSTNTLTLARRNGTISLSATANAVIMSSVPMSATMLDAVDARKIIGRTVSFLFQGSTQTANTQSNGVAYSTFTASISSGVYQIQASFAGDATYTSSVTYRNINMLPYPTVITASTVGVIMNEVFTATATLKDYNNNTVPSKSLVFYFNSSSFTAVTNGSGVAYSTYAATVSSGVYQMPVSFGGDAVYASTGAYVQVTVDRRSSSMTVEAVTVKALDVFTATATLKDGLNTSVKINGQTVVFRFYVSGSTFTNSGVSDANGVAVSTFAAPAAAGTYQYNATFSGNPTYYSSSSTGTVGVAKRDTAMSMPNSSAVIDELFATTTTLRDYETLAPVQSRTVTFTFGSSSSTVTNSSGLGRVFYSAPSSSGSFQLQSSFAGDSTYNASSSTSVLTVTRRPLNLSVEDSVGTIDEVFYSSVTLTDAINSAKAASRQVSFVFNGNTFNALSDANGVAVSSFTAAVSSGAYTIAISFPGDGRYLPNSTTSQVTIGRRPSQFSVGVISARASEVFTATASLVDLLSPGTKISGRSVAFYFEGSTFTALTDAAGVASSTFTAPSSSGTLPISISFAGDSLYVSTSTVADVVVLRRLSKLDLNSPVSVAMDTVTVTALLTDKNNPAVFANGRTVSFYFRGSTFTAVTDVTGVAVSTFSGPVSSGTYQISAYFDGDPVYEASSSTSSATVQTRAISISVNDSSAYPFEQFIASATVADSATLAPIQGRLLVFELDGTQKSGASSAAGLSTAAYTPPAVFGDYELEVSYPGDATYSASVSTGNVSVMRRPTALAPLDAGTVALDVFFATVTLSDVRFAQPIAGKELTVIFEGHSSTAASDADGNIFLSFEAPVSSGVYYYQVSFAGDSVYSPVSSTGAVTVNTRFTKIVAKDANANVGEPFLLSAQLVDPAKQDMPGYYVEGVMVEFKFKDKDNFVLDTATAATNSIGVASVTFQGPGYPDVYYYTATFAGNYTYSPSSATAMVKVGLLTSMVAYDVDTYALSDFQVKVKLVDYLTTPLDDKLVRFRFLGDEKTSLTAAQGISGVATNSFTAPSSSGTYIYTTHFDGDSIYSASNATATVTVQRRPSTVMTYAVNGLAFSTITVTVGLKDILDPEMIVGGRNIYVAFMGSTATVNTSTATGEGSTSFYAGISSGAYSYTAWFLGDDTFAASNSTGAVNLTLKPTSMLSYNVYDVLANSTFSAKVQIKDNNNQPVNDLTVDFEFGGNFGMGITNAQGQAETVFTAPPSSGTYQFNAVFSGDAEYDGSSASGDVVVGPRPTIVVTSNSSFRLGTPIPLSAKLVDPANNSGIEGKTLNFYFNGSTIPAVTDSLGFSTASFSSPGSTGTYLYRAEFVGDGVTYIGSESVSTVTVALNMTTVEARDGLSIKIYEPVSVEAVVRDSIGLQLEGMPVVFALDGSSTTSVTDSFGKATFTFVTSGMASTGAYYYSAEYPGDTLFVASSDTARLDVFRRDTMLTAKDKQSTPEKTFYAEATLTDNVNGSVLISTPLAGKLVTFQFFADGSTFTSVAMTSDQGVSSTSFTSPVSTGTYYYTATFEGDPIYVGYVSTATLTVLFDDGTGRIATRVRPELVNTYITHVFIASATLTASEEPVPDKTLVFSFFDGISTYTVPGVTDGLGVATAAFTAPASSGAFNYTASFAGDAEYSAAIGTSTISVALFPSGLAAQSVSAYIGENFTARAVLRDGLTSLELSGKTLNFQFFNGVTTVTLSAVTSSTGSAEAVFATPLTPGDYTYTVSFAGDSQYMPSSDVGTVLIASRGSSTFIIGYEVMVGTGEVFSASCTMTSRGYPVANKPITIGFGGLFVVSTTNVYGVAMTSFTAPSSSGTFVYTLVFDGDLEYNLTDSTGLVNVVYRKAPEEPALKAELSSTTLNVTWQPVTAYSSDVSGYIVEKSNSFRNGWVSQGYVASTAPALGYSCTVEEDEPTYLKVKTILNDNQQSGTSLIVEVPKAEEREQSPVNYYYINEDESAWVKIPGVVMDRVSAPFSIEIEKKSSPGFSSSYEVKAVGVSEKTLEKEFKAVDRKGVKISLYYGSMTGSGLSLKAAGQQMAIYWHNGVEWVRIGGETDLLTDEVYTYSRVFGNFALRLAPLAEGFTLTKVAPRIFTPDESSTSVNRARFYFDNPSGNEVTIRIFDVTGALVRRNLESEGASVMFWNGKDQSGEMVKAGIYIYQIEAGSEVKTGTVVVAK